MTAIVQHRSMKRMLSFVQVRQSHVIDFAAVTQALSSVNFDLIIILQGVLLNALVKFFHSHIA
jgi:hypothetical protein